VKVGFISLGCSKNLIDTEMGIGVLKNHDFEIVNDPQIAEMIIVNTFGFIESAKEEAINTILEMAEYKKKNCKYLIAMGCLVKRYKGELQKAIPEVDLWISIDEYKDFWKNISTLVYKNVEKNDYLSYRNRIITTGEKMAYLKIAEGCDNFCTYCAIPYIRGRFESRKMEDIIEEAENLAKSGIEEVILIAQDTTKYGMDIYGEGKLPELLQNLSEINGIEWIRFLYSYPEGITDELIETVANNPKIAKYFDIPIQHISNSILKKMNRKTSKEEIEKLIQKIRKRIPEVTLRTSLIVGFPGETENNFNELYEFVKIAKFDKLGVFMYSKEEGTPAAKLPEQIHGNTKKARYNKIMRKQAEISLENLQKKIGKTYRVLIENISFDGKYFIGRTMQDVPDEDGIVYVKNDGKHRVADVLNNFVECEIENVSDYDLIGIVD